MQPTALSFNQFNNPLTPSQTKSAEACSANCSETSTACITK